MTEQSETPETPEVAEVRRLLAEARHLEPMPADVAARMDDVLAGLANPETSTETSALPPARDGVVSIAAHRRRNVAALLVAAAAIVVGGVAVAPHLPQGGSSAQTTADSATAGGASSPEDGGDTSKVPGATGSDTPPATDKAIRLHKGLVVVRPRHFSTDAREGRDLLAAGGTSAFELDRASDCADVPKADGLLAAEYQRAPAALVYRHARGGTQVVDLYVCGTPEPVRSTTLPAR